MDVPAFTRLFPALYHVTFASNLPGIRQHGLLSAHALADLHCFTPEEREATLHNRRRCNQELHDLTIRDQHAAPESRMRSCLVGITVPEWLELLNGKIFFFLERERAERFAGLYSAYPNILFEIDTAALLATHADRATLSRILSGSFLANPRPRGRDSFIPIASYIYRKRRDTPSELTIDGPIPTILEISTCTHL